MRDEDLFKRLKPLLDPYAPYPLHWVDWVIVAALIVVATAAVLSCVFVLH